MSTSNWVLTGILLYVCESSNLSEVLRYPN
jgi:hypothetical protein